MDRGKKSSRGLSPQSPSRSRPANISAEQSRAQAGSRPGPGRVQAGSRLASVSPHTTIRVICLIFQKWRQNCCGSHDRLPATGPGPVNTACTFTDRTRCIFNIHTDLCIFSPFLPAQCQDCQEGRAPGWVVVVVCLKVAVPG